MIHYRSDEWWISDTGTVALEDVTNCSGKRGSLSTITRPASTPTPRPTITEGSSCCLTADFEVKSLTKHPRARICLRYVMCRRNLARSHAPLSNELMQCVKHCFARGTAFITALEVLHSMPSLQCRIERGEICQSCSICWIERKLDLTHRQYSPQDLDIIRRYLDMMGK
jgi:hypothetical protein